MYSKIFPYIRQPPFLKMWYWLLFVVALVAKSTSGNHDYDTTDDEGYDVLFGALDKDRTHTSVNDLFGASDNDRTHTSINDLFRALYNDGSRTSDNDHFGASSNDHIHTSVNEHFGASGNDRTHTLFNELFGASDNDRIHTPENTKFRASDNDGTHTSVNGGLITSAERNSIGYSNFDSSQTRTARVKYPNSGRPRHPHNDRSHTSVNVRFGTSDQDRNFRTGSYVATHDIPRSISSKTNSRDFINGRRVDSSDTNLLRTGVYDFRTSENTNDIDSVDSENDHSTGNGHFGVAGNGDFRVSDDGVFSISGDGDFRHSGNGYFRDSGEGSYRHLGNGDYSISSKGAVLISGIGNVYNEKETEKEGKLKLFQVINLNLSQMPQSPNSQPPRTTPKPHATHVIYPTVSSTTITTTSRTTTEEVIPEPPTAAEPNVTPTIFVDDSHTVTEVASPKEKASKCTTLNKADIILVMDASSSVGEANWVHQTDMAANITHYFHVGPDNVRFAALLFHRNPTKIFDLKDYTSHSSLEYNLKKVPYPRHSGTYTHEALNYIMTQNMFGTASGGRDDAPKLVIVMTDGKSNNPLRTLDEARKLKANGISIISVGIGRHLSYEELIGVASTQDNVIMATSYQALGDSLGSLVKLACQVTSEPPTAAEPNVTPTIFFDDSLTRTEEARSEEKVEIPPAPTAEQNEAPTFLLNYPITATEDAASAEQDAG
ncbi:uncharacterized protein LOC131951789 [Physella acuta]|uniref:uncharacterized protein LOC131951789 n=1 Tax=Physella acuta TaxID=109671 RepID=UPI0027DE239C|nr:uncharacterized protein LOC131951789 [Physella acuta]